MLDFNRNPQFIPDSFAALAIPEVIIPQVASRAYWDNQTVEVRLHTAHNTSFNWDGYKLQWELKKASGTEAIRTVKGSPTAIPVSTARVPMPRVQSAQLIALTLRLMDAQGYEVMTHCEDLLVLPSHAAQARYSDPIAVMTCAGSESAIVRQLNYAVNDLLTAETKMVVTNSPDSNMLSLVRAGGRMLFISENDDPVFWQNGRGSTGESNWITSTSWLRPEVYPNLKLDDPLNLPLHRVMPQSSINGLPQEDASVQRDFLAGRIAGWVQRPTIHTVQFGYGDGTVLMTTYRILESLRFGDPDPAGVIMLNDLIDYLVSDGCKPVLRIKV